MQFLSSVCKKTPISALRSQQKLLIYQSKLRVFAASCALTLTFSYQTSSFLSDTK